MCVNIQDNYYKCTNEKLKNVFVGVIQVNQFPYPL